MFSAILKKGYDLFLLWRSRSILFQAGSLAALVFSLVAGGFLFLFLIVWIGLTGKLPNQEELTKLQNPIASEVYSSDSVLLGRYYIQERSDVAYHKIPTHVIDALLVTEDVRFYDHRGIDYQSFIRVFIKSVLLQGNGGGGSTLTQQLAKNLFPRKNYWLLSLPINKIREMILATRLEKVYDKPSLISLYLNTVSFGENAFGIEAAAQRYFSKHASQLTLEEGAVLIGMLKATYLYNPRIYPQNANTRRNVVLAQLKKYGKLSEAQCDSLQRLPMVIAYSRLTHHSGLAPYFREQLRQELVQWCENYNRENDNDRPINLYTDGLKIYTTIDSRMQQYAELAMEKQMAKLQKLFDQHWGKTKPWHQKLFIFEEALKKSNSYQRLAKSGKSHEEILAEMSKPRIMRLYSWEGEKEVTISAIDSIQYYLKFLNTGVLAMNPKDGAVRVWVGGINHNYFQFDHVKESTKRQVGSTIKPIVYAAALEQGAKPCSYISAEKITYENTQERSADWIPGNTEDNYHLKYSMEGGLAYSVNTVAVHVLENTGIDSTIALARKMGIRSTLPSVPSFALGSPSISVMEMVTAYSAIANSGYAVTPYYITSIIDRDGKTLQSFESEKSTPVLSEDNARLMVEMMKRSVTEGTAASIRNTYKLDNDMAAKTGTTQSNADGWFITMTPNLVMGAWVGADDPGIRFRSGALGSGAATALPIVANFFQFVNQDKSLKEISQAKFPELPSHLANKLNCNLYKEDTNFLEKLFGKQERDTTRKFGEPEKRRKKSLWKRLFNS